jgi:hypothetical protein
MQRDRALHHLTAIRREVGQFTDLESSWDALEPDDRIGYRAEWDNMLDRFSAVVQAYVDRRLGHDVSAQLVDVARCLVAFTPSLERMQLRQPSADDLRHLGILSAA